MEWSGRMGWSGRRTLGLVIGWLACVTTAGVSSAQNASPSPEPSDTAAVQGQMSMNMGGTANWQFMQDGILFAEFNQQGSERGGREFAAPNWWMGMATRKTRARAVHRHQHVEPRAGDRWSRRLSRDLPGRRSPEWSPPDRSAASARLLHAAGSGLAGSAWSGDRADTRRGARWRAGARSGGVHASGFRGRQSNRAVEPSHVRLDARLVRRDHGGRRSRSVAR